MDDLEHSLSPQDADRLMADLRIELLRMTDIDTQRQDMTGDRKKQILKAAGIGRAQAIFFKQGRAREIRRRYVRLLRLLIRRFWSGELDQVEFSEAAYEASVDAYWDAFGEGRQAGGVDDEVEVGHQEGGIVFQQLVWANTSVSKIVVLLMAADGDEDRLKEALGRVDFMASAIDELWYEGLASAAGDRMYQWILGGTKEHCTDCLAYNGQRHRLSEWQAAGAIPNSYALECHGFHCQCELRPTRGGPVGVLNPPGMN